MNKFLLIMSLAFLALLPNLYAYEGLDLDESEFVPIAKKYVNNEFLNIRKEPIDGMIVGQLKRGDTVLVYDINQDWSRISKEREEPQWVFSQYLCSFEGCSKSKNSFSSTTKSSISRKAPASKPLQINRFSQSYSGSCSCSSGTYCYGPRGGRYCYTSGGNKSYR
ncbi:SH3 domain-containing protein [Acinetobacter sp. P8-3-8]|uniref:SH3 domain-containing protein n=1 Tax=Acinetobacter sp. P8-3-8 TaxID=1029823 RepID=UPI0002485922|nr:SH3 domain-containing protein [Acinetobacter sp. P8-3-8]